ncbi:OPT domain-containing protein [Trichoderma novae-zelandiae]
MSDSRGPPSGGVFDEKAQQPFDATVEDAQTSQAEIEDTTIAAVGRHLVVTEDDLLEARDTAASYSLEDVRRILAIVHNRHKHDLNFPSAVLLRVGDFLDNESIFDNPEKHQRLIEEMKIETALIINNSPYAPVRAIVDNHDDPSLPVSTIRAWFMGIIFAACVACINAFFAIRLPAIAVGSNVVQLLAYPVGKFMEKTLPDWGFTLFGVRHSLNPGPFNKKEHMLISLMSAISVSQPYTNNIIWIQYLPRFFNQAWAKSMGYQLLIALSTNFIGYGLAGLCRRFLVYPSFCAWPLTLVTIALNSAFHADGNPAVPGPFGTVWTMSRFRFFAFAFIAMFCWFWVPGYLFTGLSVFSWMTWIAPQSRTVGILTGSTSGVGFNPFPTLDWAVVTTDIEPLITPIFTTINLFCGGLFFGLVILAIYYTDGFHTSHLPIVSNTLFDRFGKAYNVSSIIDSRGILDPEKYRAYSPPYISAGNTVTNFGFFTIYTGALTYGFLYHRHEVIHGFSSLFDSFRPSRKKEMAEAEALDVHNRLMKAYKEVPEWWYLLVLAVSIVLGCVALAHYPTYTSPGVVFFGIALALVFIVPTGIILSMTGIEVSLNVLAEFIGGSWVEGNALAMCYFKTFGYITCSHALHFSAELKIAHYLKIPPRIIFFGQMIPTLFSTVVCVAVLQFQMSLDNVCAPTGAPYAFSCPTANSFFTAAVLWGTVGPRRLWGANGTYTATLAGFPIGIAVVLAFWFLGKKFPRNSLLRNVHPVVLLYGGCLWNPFNLTYLWPAVPIACASWLWVKVRYLAFWAKYNYILSAGFSTGLAISALIQFFGLTYHGVYLGWWGNTVITKGCDLFGLCRLNPMAPGESFGPGPGEFR